MTTKEKILAAATVIVFTMAARGSSIETMRQRFPDADAVVVDMFDDMVYQPDGSYVSETTESVLILTEKGRRENSEIELRYSARYSKAEILEVAIKSSDGRVRNVDLASTTNETTDNSSASANIYDPMDRKVVCTIPGLKIGDTMTYKTRRSAFAARVKDQWADMAVLEWEVPILHATVRVKSPAERPLKSKALRHSLGNVKYAEEKLDDGSIVRTWTSENSPQMFPEPDMPPMLTQVECLRFSTASDWKEISRWYWQVSEPHLAKTNEAITNKVNELGHDIPAIYKWVAQEVRYMGLTMEDTAPGYAPHDVDITFGNRYGVCRDKAALLVAMLRIAGFEAYPVLIHAGAKIDPEVPMPYFNHAIACVADGNGGYILMDPTDESSRDLLPAYLSDRSYLVATPKGETLRTSPIPPAEENSVKVVSKAKLASDGSLLLDSSIMMNGINDNVYRQVLLRRRKEARRKLFEKLITGVAPGGELLELEIKPENLQDTTKPLEITLSARLPGSLVEGEALAELAPPMLSRVFGTANWLLEGKTSLETRKYPLVVDSTAMVEEDLEIDLADVVGGVAHMPADAKVSGAYAFERTYSLEDGKLKMHRRHAINAIEFSPVEYLEMRERIKEVEAAERQRPIFAKRRFKGANARVFLDRDDVTVVSPRSWVVTNTVEEQVLSYDGKKNLSELKFDYNPTWKKVEVVSATVSNKSGRVSAVTNKEINEFDATWAALAPRYPASKRLIVNLPGVEVGSVIRYTIATTITDSPTEFYGQWFFDSQEPTDVVAVSINGEERLVSQVQAVSAEPMTATPSLWRDTLCVSSNDWGRAAKMLQPALEVKKLKRDEFGESPWGRSIRSIRDWMARHVRVSGPSVFETRIEAQCTDPATVIKERYASRMDYIRTMCSLLRGAGFNADIVFASLDSQEAAEIRERDLHSKPCLAAFAYPLCRVRERIGGFLWWGGKVNTYYLGTENEYAPLGATAYANSTYFNPEDGSFGTVKAASEDLEAGEREEITMFVRENGDVDFEVEIEKRGPAVAAFRKQYSEMLPEDRLRHYQALLGEISHSASATSELETDVEGYPATLRFKAYVGDFSVVADDLITISTPAFLEHLFSMPGARRLNPIGVAAADPKETRVRIVFPAGYTKVEYLPDAFTFSNPKDGEAWYTNNVSSTIEKSEDGTERVVITIDRKRLKRPYAMLGKDYAPLLQGWSRMGNCRSARLVGVRAK